MPLAMDAVTYTSSLNMHVCWLHLCATASSTHLIRSRHGSYLDAHFSAAASAASSASSASAASAASPSGRNRLLIT